MILCQDIIISFVARCVSPEESSGTGTIQSVFVDEDLVTRVLHECNNGSNKTKQFIRQLS